MPYADLKARDLELITIALPPGNVFSRMHNPKVFDDDMAVRRSMKGTSRADVAIRARVKNLLRRVQDRLPQLHYLLREGPH
jgi:hypothetical protein